MDQEVSGKQDKAAHAAVTIPTTNWKQDDTSGYPCYYDLTVIGVTINHRADIAIAPSSLSTAAACGLCPSTETLADTIRLRAAAVPETAMAAEYWIELGRE